MNPTNLMEFNKEVIVDEKNQEQIRQIVKNTINNNGEMIGDWSDSEIRIDVNCLDHIAEEIADKIVRLAIKKLIKLSH